MQRPSTPAGEPDPDDLRLVQRVKEGDPGAFDEFVARFGPLILAFGMRMCGNRPDAEDVFQETLIKVYTSLATLENPRALRTWFWRVVANECLMSRRGPRDPSRTVGLGDLVPQESTPGAELELPDAAAVSPERALLDTERRERLERALGNLPPDYRIVILLRDFEGLSTQEVADVLGISATNAKVRLHRARAALRQRLQPPAAAEDGRG
ncbi:MAG: sigma-70 family RNA polymerase sigma factor [Acidobacteria bacterium]|nr:sigma-70 family RNA polymerase sigma factor [Acidobacteriota bacterium]